MPELLIVLRTRLETLRGAPMLMKIEAADAALVAALAVLEDQEARIHVLEQQRGESRVFSEEENTLGKTETR